MPRIRETPFRHVCEDNDRTGQTKKVKVRLRNLQAWGKEMKMLRTTKFRLMIAAFVFAAWLAWGSDAKSAGVHGYVLDSACAFTKSLKKPISAECAQACARAGSPLVILADNGTIYWPIANTTPAAGQNDRLLPFAGQRVTATGRVYARGGSSAIVIEKIGGERSK